MVALFCWRLNGRTAGLSSLDLGGLGRMGYATLLGSAMAYGLFFWFANRRDLTTFSSLGFLTPVFALATGGWFLGERLNAPPVGRCADGVGISGV